MKSENTTKPYRQHVVERLKTFEDAGAYLAASLEQNADYPAAIGLAIEDIIVAFNLPLLVNVISPASAAPVVANEALKKRARQIIDAVVKSPCVVEVRFFSQPEESEKLENEIAALIAPAAAATAAPVEQPNTHEFVGNSKSLPCGYCGFIYSAPIHRHEGAR